MRSKLFFSLDAIKPQHENAEGSVTYVTSKQVPSFVNISFSFLKLKSNGLQEPIWHPDANKMGYCIKGRAIVTMRSPTAVDIFTVEEGDIFFRSWRLYS